MTEVLAQAGAIRGKDPGESLKVFQQVLLIFARMGPPEWKCPALFTNLWTSMEECYFGGTSLGDLELGRVDGDNLRFRLERWDPVGRAAPPALTPVADGSLEQLKGLAEPGPGIYRLLLDRPGPDGGRVAAWEAWLLFTHWEVDLYTLGRPDRDPAAYDALLRGKPSAHCRVSNLSLPHTQPKPGPWPGGGETYFALAASSSIDLPEGRYRFSVTSDDGVRLYVDGRLAIDSWLGRTADRDDAVLDLASGRHELRVEYFQTIRGMALRVQLAPAADLPVTSLPVRGSDGFETRRRKAESSRIESALTAEIQQSPSSAQALFDRAQFYTGERRFAESAADYAAGLKINAGNPWDWVNSAVVALQAGDVEGYGRQCAEMLGRFGATTNRNDCERIVRDCAALPDAVPDLKTVMAMADRAVAPDDVNGTSYMRALPALAKGMVEYRAGHFESAAQWLQRALPGMESAGQCVGCFFLAMAESKRGHGSDAEAAFVKGNELYNRDGPEGDTFPQPYKEWIMALHARKEAAALLGRSLEPVATQARDPTFPAADMDRRQR
jgi:tetratricopeptide (TPR) repeat protein